MLSFALRLHYTTITPPQCQDYIKDHTVIKEVGALYDNDCSIRAYSSTYTPHIGALGRKATPPEPLKPKADRISASK